jgi:hypothetical protein
MIRLKAKQQEKKAEEQQQAADAAAAAAAGNGESAVAEKPKTIKILGVGRGKRTGASKEKKRTPGEIRIQKGTAEGFFSSGRCVVGMRGRLTAMGTGSERQISRSSTADKPRPSRSRK